MAFIEDFQADPSCSSFAFITMLAIYASRPLHAKTNTALPHAVVVDRAESIVRPVVPPFVTGETELEYDHEGHTPSSQDQCSNP